jgi:hypothetical protein
MTPQVKLTGISVGFHVEFREGNKEIINENSRTLAPS